MSSNKFRKLAGKASSGLHILPRALRLPIGINRILSCDGIKIYFGAMGKRDRKEGTYPAFSLRVAEAFDRLVTRVKGANQASEILGSFSVRQHHLVQACQLFLRLR